ncbi:hypothetical protein X759_26915 [Mesorhizobium sp. LSHC420B00]|uniref:hypothetical protein n=1 Tax=unclassified Mesorhizobium TaxID=325217 RepID=UPI0003CDD443|nr:hypothetical protein X759_26915 [Mesorhizobium sp. LSHC420B00]
MRPDQIVQSECAGHHKGRTGANTDTDRQVIYNTYTELLKRVEAKGGLSKTEVYEEAAKALFTKEPANMKLLVVVDKLLTAFDALHLCLHRHVYAGPRPVPSDLPDQSA